MKKNLIRIALCLTGLAVALLTVRMMPVQMVAQANRVATAAPEAAEEPIALACPGRIEGKSETISVGAATDGVIQAIWVREGQRVTRGDALAGIGCSDLESAREVSRAEADSLRQTRVRLMHGSRDEERQAAAQKTIAARAVLSQAKGQMERMTKLWDAAATSRASFEEARRDYDVADAQLKQAIRNEELSNAPPLQEELAKSDADIHAAEQRIQLAEEKLGKCIVRAPEDGTILRVHMRAGESFTVLAPKALFSMADVSVRRVRAEVDEKDIRSVRIGQRILISTDADRRNRAGGKVIKIASMMGRKSVFTGQPTDKSDRDILEVLADLDGPAGENLPVGLRVTVDFLR
jgi:multidrug resistance efflux pump